MQLSDIVAELYALPPGEFVGRRDERAASARQVGDPELAAAIKALRRPTVSAALLNAVARESAEELDEFLALGASLRKAQEAGNGDRLRELMRSRQGLSAGLEAQVAALAVARGISVTPAVLREVQATLLAATSDPDVAQAVRAGSLSTAITYAGFGSGPVSPAAKAPAAPPTRPSRDDADRAAAKQAKAAAAAAERRRREARARVTTGERSVADLAARLTAAEATVAELARQLAVARDRLAQLEHDAAET